MVFKLTNMLIGDSCGVLKTKTIHVYNKPVGKYNTVGRFLKNSNILVLPKCVGLRKRKYKSFIIRTKKHNINLDKSISCFNSNTHILLKKRLAARGFYIKGPTISHIKRKKFLTSFNVVI